MSGQDGIVLWSFSLGFGDEEFPGVYVSSLWLTFTSVEHSGVEELFHVFYLEERWICARGSLNPIHCGLWMTVQWGLEILEEERHEGWWIWRFFWERLERPERILSCLVWGPLDDYVTPEFVAEPSEGCSWARIRVHFEPKLWRRIRSGFAGTVYGFPPSKAWQM